MVKIDGEIMRRYNLGILKGALDDFGIAEEILLGIFKIHDREQKHEMLRSTSCFCESDI